MSLDLKPNLSVAVEQHVIDAMRAMMGELREQETQRSDDCDVADDNVVVVPPGKQAFFREEHLVGIARPDADQVSSLQVGSAAVEEITACGDHVPAATDATKFDLESRAEQERLERVAKAVAARRAKAKAVAKDAVAEKVTGTKTTDVASNPEQKERLSAGKPQRETKTVNDSGKQKCSRSSSTTSSRSSSKSSGSTSSTGNKQSKKVSKKEKMKRLADEAARRWFERDREAEHRMRWVEQRGAAEARSKEEAKKRSEIKQQTAQDLRSAQGSLRDVRDRSHPRKRSRSRKRRRESRSRSQRRSKKRR